MDWFPIDTAPKDGTTILGHDTERLSDEGWMMPVSWKEPGEYFKGPAGWYVAWDHERYVPTHWMPMPAPHPSTE